MVLVYAWSSVPWEQWYRAGISRTSVFSLPFQLLFIDLLFQDFASFSTRVLERGSTQRWTVKLMSFDYKSEYHAYDRGGNQAMIRCTEAPIIQSSVTFLKPLVWLFKGDSTHSVVDFLKAPKA